MSLFKEQASKIIAGIYKMPTNVVSTLAAFFCGSVAVSALTMFYLALVLPMLDQQVFYRVTTTAGIAPVVGAQNLRPWFGVGALSAVTDAAPIAPLIKPISGPVRTNVALVAITSGAPLPGIAPGQFESPLRVTFGRPPIVAAPRPAFFELLAQPDAVGQEDVVLVAYRPHPRPMPEIAEPVSVVAEADLEPEAAVDNLEVAELSIETGLESYAIRTSPRPGQRPASLAATQTVLAHNAARAVPDTPAATDQPAAQLASVTQPSNGLFSGGSTRRFSGECSSRLSRAIPRRNSRAQTGSAFIATLASTSGGARDTAIAREIMSGNVPEFLRNLVPVTFTGTLGNGRETSITLCVTPDYLALGNNTDYVRVPMGLSAAGQIAERFDMMLPTTRMVDAIYAQAAIHLSPKPMSPGSQMSSTPYFVRHNATVERQRNSANGALGVLVSGHKKDLVLTNRLASSPGRVAIYGWHRRSGSPIQPLSTVHGAGYADYSHGIRLVSQTAYVDGRAVDLQALLQDRQYARFLNSDGVIGRPAIRLAGL